MDHTVWDVEWAKRMHTTGGRFGPKRVREEVYRNNCHVLGQWSYRNSSGNIVPLGDRESLVQGTKVYSQPFTVAHVGSCANVRKIGCANLDCMEVARDLIADGRSVAILNLASRRHPCGGYDDGLNAQEEALCRASTLSVSLYQYYDAAESCVRKSNVEVKWNAYPLDIEFGGIYSPDVVFFRHGEKEGYAFRDDPFACSVVSVAALSFRPSNRYSNDELRYQDSVTGGFTAEGERIQLNKIRTIFRLALVNGRDSLVLGAFGCGVNRLPVKEVARQFKAVMTEPEFEGKFRDVCFAILEGSANNGRLVEDAGRFAAFYSEFGRW